MDDLIELKLVPDKSSYSVEGQDIISVKLDGGRPFQRLDVVGAWRQVEVLFMLPELEFTYLNAFLEGVANHGTTPFKVRLVLDEPKAKMHEAMFAGGSLRWNFANGIYNVNARLVVKPSKPSGYERDFVLIANDFGFDWLDINDPLDYEVNTHIPRALCSQTNS